MTGTAQLLNDSTCSAGLAGLQSAKSLERLKQIASLRARGISQSIDLPQLVVCGDQSAGKSSVLEGITNIPFPVDNGVCTKFPTEVILEHSDAQDSITASIIPHPCRLDVSKCQLRSFHATITDYSELPGVIGAAGELMGLRGYGGNKDGPVFVGDVLRIKVVGRTGLHLSIVDLPGLISTASEEQTQADVDIVHRMVDAYIEKPRTIILAIVQASNDIANQSIIRKSKDFDKAGQRTVGVITKPDLINKGTEGRIALLAKNQDTTKLQLGFFILKNPTPSEMKAQITPKQRSANELQFFSAWKEHGLDPGRVGIDKLRDSLQHLLDQHIERELPKVRAEITSMIKSTEQDLINLPKERHTVADLRVYLSGLAMQYHGLVEAALDGNYNTAHASFFTAQGQAISQARLRAVVHKANTEFSTHMRQRGRVFTLTSDRSKIKIRHGQAGELTDFDVGDGFDTVYVDEELMKTWVRQIYQTTRGRELPGNYSHVLLTELFHCQSQRWAQLAEDHVDAVADHIEVFVTQAMYYVNMEDHVRVEMLEGIHVKLQEYKRKAKEELAQLREDELGQPITYNHYYTDNVHHARLNSLGKLFEKAVLQISYDGKVVPGMSLASLRGSVHKNIHVDMDERACAEALTDLDAYYKVARKTFVDNVCRQVIERHLLRNLPSIFSPEDVAGYSDDKLQSIAGERQEAVARRKELTELLETLRAGLKDLRK